MMHRQFFRNSATLLLMGSLLGISACGGMRQAMGIEKSMPDEFAIVTQAPLVVPPDFSLKPPAPGARGAGAKSDAELIAARAIVGDPNVFTPGMSSGERALVQAAGAQFADPLIRQVVDQEYAEISRRSEEFSNRLMFGDKAVVPDKPIDARAEADRISEKQEGVKTGGPPKQEKPTIEKNDGGPLSDLF